MHRSLLQASILQYLCENENRSFRALDDFYDESLISGHSILQGDASEAFLQSDTILGEGAFGQVRYCQLPSRFLETDETKDETKPDFSPVVIKQLYRLSIAKDEYKAHMAFYAT